MTVLLNQIQKVGWTTIAQSGVDELNKCLLKFNITTLNNIQHFISQCSHESACGRYTEEIADGKAYDPPANVAKTLGNTQVGDGPKYKGAGYIQLTGRANYAAFSKYMNDELILSQGVKYVAANYPWTSAGFWWFNNGMSKLCNGTPAPTVTQVTKKVNGGTNGLAEREKYFNLCCSIFTVTSANTNTVKQTLKKGSTGADVKYLQQRLNILIGSGLAVDGIFGPKTEAAVRNFQAFKRIKIDGIVGIETWPALG